MPPAAALRLAIQEHLAHAGASDGEVKVLAKQQKYRTPAELPPTVNPFDNMWVPWLAVSGLGPVFDATPLATYIANRRTGNGAALLWPNFHSACIGEYFQKPLCTPSGSVLLAMRGACAPGAVPADCNATGVSFGSMCVGQVVAGGTRDSVSWDAPSKPMVRVDAFKYPVLPLLPYNHLTATLPLRPLLLQASLLLDSTAGAIIAAAGLRGTMQELQAPEVNASSSALYVTAAASPGQSALGLPVVEVQAKMPCDSMSGAGPACPQQVGVSGTVFVPDAGSAMRPLAVGLLPSVSWGIAGSTSVSRKALLQLAREAASRWSRAGALQVEVRALLPSTQSVTQQPLQLAGELVLGVSDSGAARGQTGVALLPNVSVGGASVLELWTQGGAPVNVGAATHGQSRVGTFPASGLPGDVQAWVKWLSYGSMLASAQVRVDGDSFPLLRGVHVAELPGSPALQEAKSLLCQVAGFFWSRAGTICDRVVSAVTDALGDDDEGLVLYPNRQAVDDSASMTSGTTSTSTIGSVPGVTFRSSHWVAKVPGVELPSLSGSGLGLPWAGGVQVAPAACADAASCLSWLTPGATTVWSLLPYVQVRLTEGACSPAAPQAYLQTIRDTLQAWYTGAGQGVPLSERVLHSACGGGRSACMVLRGRASKVQYVLTERLGSPVWRGTCRMRVEVGPANASQSVAVGGDAPCGVEVEHGAWLDCLARVEGGDGDGVVTGGVGVTDVMGTVPAPLPSASPSASPSVSPSASPSASASVVVSPYATPSVTASVTATASVSPSVSPSVSAAISPSSSPVILPSASTTPSIAPSSLPSFGTSTASPTASGGPQGAGGGGSSSSTSGGLSAGGAAGVAVGVVLFVVAIVALGVVGRRMGWFGTKPEVEAVQTTKVPLATVVSPLRGGR